MSARVRTVDTFSFTYGRVEVKAQLPKGDWIWPAIWLLPNDQEFGTWPASGEIDIMESRGNDVSCSAGGNDHFGSTLHWGPSWDNNRYDLTTKQYKHTESLANDFHIYGLLWTPDRIMTYLDTEDNVVLDVDTSSQSFWEKGGFKIDNPWVGEPNNAPFNRDFYLIMNVAVGGTNAYFPDGQCGKPWTNTDSRSANTFWNTKDQWYPTWNYPATHQSAMKIDSVKVWSLDSTESFLE
jgi:beta-glucanase (GH16 family)